MKALLVLLVAAAGVVYGHQLWRDHQHSVSRREALALADGNGFIPVQMPDGAQDNSVLILAPLNCPHEGARRADALAGRLRELGIPGVRSNQYSVSRITRSNQADFNRAVVVMQDNVVPVVFINGRAKANPSVAEVVSEFRQQQ
jgi:hypothetical protein